MVKITCNGETLDDCVTCGWFRSSHSTHYSEEHKQKVYKISCSIGGDRTFSSEEDNYGVILDKR